MRIGDNFAFHIRPPFPDPATVGRQAIVGTFVPTMEASSVCSEILRRLSDFPRRQPGAVILSGLRGVGKTHLLRFLLSILEHPNDAAWNQIEPQLRPVARPRRAFSSLYLDLPEDSSIDLLPFLLNALSGQALSRTEDPGSIACADPEEYAARLRKLAAVPSTPPLALIAIDSAGRRLMRVRDPHGRERERRILHALVKAYCEEGVLVVLVGDEGELAPGAAAADAGIIPQGREHRWQVTQLRPANIAQVISSALASKDAHQRARIEKILGRLHEKLPSLGPSLEAMADLYPIHPFVFQELFELRSIFPDFNPLQFVQLAIKASRTLPADRLVTIDWLLDYILPDLEKRGEFGPLVASYEEFLQTVIPQLKPQIRQRAAELLKAIALMTACNIGPATVTTIAEALLLSDETDQLSAYSLTAAILGELEIHGRRYLSAEGTLYDRRYRLVSSVQQLPGLQRAGPEELKLQVPLMLFDWFQSRFPSWTLALVPSYQRISQSIAVTIKDANRNSSGLVHFKSPFNPLWSGADLEALDDGTYEWILLVLGPLERLQEMDPCFQELVQSSRRLLIWRPDSPLDEEVEQLQAIAGLQPYPRIAGAQKDPGLVEARNAARRTFSILYIERGRLLSNGTECRARPETPAQSLEAFLSARLLALSSGSRAAKPAGETNAPVSSLLGREDSDERLWAALLTGDETLRTANLDRARGRLLDWWATQVGMQRSPLSSGWDSWPETFLTSQFAQGVDSFVKTLEMLAPLFQRLSRDEINVASVMAQVGLAFNRNRDRLQQWKKMLEGLPGLIRWLDKYEQAADYVSGAFPTSLPGIEELRHALLKSADDPRRFLAASNREAFDRSFLEFKQSYIDCYCAAHDKTLGLIDTGSTRPSAIDPVALRNLELLSELPYADRSYVNRIRIIGSWIQANRCSYPVHEILERFPRCYCSFNPMEARHLGDLAPQINAVIREGIDHFRGILRACRELIMQELTSLRLEDQHCKPIAALLDCGPMLPLKPRSIEILHQTMLRHPRHFLAGARRD